MSLNRNRHLNPVLFNRMALKQVLSQYNLALRGDTLKILEQSIVCLLHECSKIDLDCGYKRKRKFTKLKTLHPSYLVQASEKFNDIVKREVESKKKEGDK